MTGASCTISVNNELEELERIYEMLDGFVESHGLEADARNALLLVTEELFANVVRYGYEDGTQDKISITADIHDGATRLTIRDRAKFFDITKPPRLPEEEISLDDMEIGGLGLFLIHEFAQSISQARDGDSNLTEIVLKNEMPG